MIAIRKIVPTGKTPAGVNSVARAPLTGSAATQKTAPANPPKKSQQDIIADVAQWVGANKSALVIGLITAAAGAWITLQLARR